MERTVERLKDRTTQGLFVVCFQGDTLVFIDAVDTTLLDIYKKKIIGEVP